MPDRRPVAARVVGDRVGEAPFLEEWDKKRRDAFVDLDQGLTDRQVLKRCKSAFHRLWCREPPNVDDLATVWWLRRPEGTDGGPGASASRQYSTSTSRGPCLLTA